MICNLVLVTQVITASVQSNSTMSLGEVPFQKSRIKINWTLINTFRIPELKIKTGSSWSWYEYQIWGVSHITYFCIRCFIFWYLEITLCVHRQRSKLTPANPSKWMLSGNIENLLSDLAGDQWSHYHFSCSKQYHFFISDKHVHVMYQTTIGYVLMLMCVVSVTQNNGLPVCLKWR